MSNNVYQLIANVSADLCREGISKERKNSQQGYSFRGIDDVYNALAPIMSKHGLVILPRILSREMVERQNKSGSYLFYVIVEAEFDFVSSHDGSKHTVKTYGEAMDSGDKATNKAMSAAYKYAAFQTFCIPTEGDNDADQHTHEVATKKFLKPEPPKVEAKEETKIPPHIEGFDTGWQIKVTVTPEANLEDWSEKVTQAAKTGLTFCANKTDVTDLFKVNRNIFDKLKQLDPGTYKSLMEDFSSSKAKFEKGDVA
jgi:hypothetical protein